MILTKTSTHATFTSNVNAEAGAVRDIVRTGERVIIELQMSTSGVEQFIVNTVSYYTDASGYVAIDITDELRASVANGYTTIDYDIEQDDDQLTWEFTIKEGLTPQEWMLPRVPQLDGETATGLQIFPPCTIYQHPVLSLTYPLYIEALGIAANGNDWTGYPYKNAQSDEQLAFSNGHLILPNESLGLTTEPDWIAVFENEDLGVTMRTILLRECDNAILLQWKSRFGVVKRAIWKVKKIKTKATEIELLPLGDGYKQERGELVSLTAYIEGLDAYSAAYYADILTSGEVHGIMSSDDDLTSFRSLVKVGTGDFVQADGNAGELQTLEITINLKQYDAI